MSHEESKKLAIDNLKWLSTIVSVIPDLSFIEPTAQALGLLNLNFTDDEIIIIGVAGFIATKARIIDENKFQNLTPNDYFHHAYVLLKLMKKENPSEEEFLNLMNKLYK